MSTVTLHDQGYTPPDFLEKMLRGTSSCSSNTGSSFHRISLSDNIYSSTQSIPAATIPKLTKAHSLAEQQKISTTKFRLFFKTIAHGIYSEEEILSIWQKFQTCMNNPFEFDKFIEDVRSKAETKKQQKQKQPVILSELKVDKLPIKSSSCSKKMKKREHSSKRRGSAEKRDCLRRCDHQSIKQQMGYIKKILVHGQKFIRAR